MAKIFISYDRASKDIVEELVQDLRDEDHDVWFDQHLTGGQKWWNNILSEIRKCEIFVAALTPDSLESSACQREMKYANDLQRILLPVRLSDKVSPDSLPLGLSELQWVDYTLRNIAALKSLRRTLKNLPKAPPLPDPLPAQPPVPISYLSQLREKIESDSLVRQDQIQLVFELRQQFRKGERAKEMLDLLQRLNERDDIFAAVSHEIDDLIRDIGREFPISGRLQSSKSELPGRDVANDASQPQVVPSDEPELRAPGKGDEPPKPPPSGATAILPEPPAVSQHIAPPEREPPLRLTGNGAASGEAKPQAQLSSQIAAGLFIVVGLSLVVILPAIYFYMGSAKKAEQPQSETSFGLSPPSRELAPSNLPAAAPAPSNLAAAGPSPLAATPPGSEFTECASACPKMIVVPAGKFLMGSPENETGREGPQREVTIARPFAASKFEVTFAEWNTCAAASACPQVEDRGRRGQMPVIDVSWDDAKGYVGWLSRLTGKEYRLLTEAEWEYAARAGTQTRYSWGDEPGKGNANCDGCGSQWDNKQTAPVGQFKPNAFGLYDMAGNVWEWVADVWHDDYKGAPTDGSAWIQGGDASRRVVRGGSWVNDPQYLRAASRAWYTSGHRDDNLGFRVGRALTP
jgi:formylglycine-generating enzyme required for sulfatase activity